MIVRVCLGLSRDVDFGVVDGEQELRVLAPVGMSKSRWMLAGIRAVHVAVVSRPVPYS